MLHKSDSGSERITWLASFPKSGNTWLRALLQAYRCGGYLNINDMFTAIGDSAACYTRAVSPIPLNDLGMAGQLQLRPAALLNALMSKPVPRIFKTHFANIRPAGVPAFIPSEFTERAVYIIRDPRDVVTSFGKFYGVGIERACEAMADNDHWIGDNGTQTVQIISSWSNHVASWGGEQRFPVHFIKYEDMLENPARELTEVLEFMGWPVDEEMVAKAVEVCELSLLREQEQETGFAENPREKERGAFFNAGGSRWQDELAPKWIRRIERDHGDIMAKFGYLENNVVEIDRADSISEGAASVQN